MLIFYSFFFFFSLLLHTTSHLPGINQKAEDASLSDNLVKVSFFFFFSPRLTLDSSGQSDFITKKKKKNRIRECTKKKEEKKIKNIKATRFKLHSRGRLFD